MAIAVASLIDLPNLNRFRRLRNEPFSNMSPHDG